MNRENGLWLTIGLAFLALSGAGQAIQTTTTTQTTTPTTPTTYVMPVTTGSSTPPPSVPSNPETPTNKVLEVVSGDDGSNKIAGATTTDTTTAIPTIPPAVTMAATIAATIQDAPSSQITIQRVNYPGYPDVTYYNVGFPDGSSISMQGKNGLTDAEVITQAKATESQMMAGMFTHGYSFTGLDS